MKQGKISVFIKRHSAFLIVLLSFLTVLAVYPNLNKYAYLIFFTITVLYCFYVFFGKYKHTKKVLLFSAVFLVSLFYCSITYTSFYPARTTIKNTIAITTFTGWNYYNYLALALKNKRLSVSIEPSDKLKALNDPYDYIELNENLSWQKFDYILDFSFYKGKYYIYFGIVPVLTVYLPFILVANNFITDALVVLFFALLSFYLSVFIFFRLYQKFIRKKDFVFELMAVFSAGLCSSFVFLISFPRVYEVAIITAVFFCLLSFLFIYLNAEAKTSGKKNIFLLMAGICIGLACGCRPFYALVVLCQVFIISDFRTIRQNWKDYLFYAVLVFFCAAGLMFYNYVRFDSVFEFGIKYQLTVYDIGNWTLSLPNMWHSLKTFLFFSPVYMDTFPYVYMRFSSGMWHNGEAVTGLFYLMPFILFLPAGYFFFKDKSVSLFYKKYVSGLLAAGIIILLVVSTMGTPARFLADFSMYLIIPLLFLCAFWYDKCHEKVRESMIRYVLITALMLGVVFSFSVSVSASLGIFKFNMPELYIKTVSLF